MDFSLFYVILFVMFELIAIFLYFSCLFFFVLRRRKKRLTQEDFVIGSRSMNRWMTALSAHASDMSNWLFMAYPGMVFLYGGQHFWAALGLIVMMLLNWVMIAPKIRRATEKTHSVTLIDFFEKRLGGEWSSGRVITSCALFLFYTVYISGALYGMGFLVEALFGIPYALGVLMGVCLIIPYLLIGGYTTLAQIDLIQGVFLLLVLLFVPLFVSLKMGGLDSFHFHGRNLSLFSGSLGENLLLMLGWGLGYFGQPHILSKFMGIREVGELKASMGIGIGWLILTLGAASLVGIVGISFFDGTLANPEQVFVQMVRQSFPSFVSGVFLCAIIAAILNAVSAMLLVLSTTFTEDLYKRFTRRSVTSKEGLFVSRISSIVVACIAMGIALNTSSTIDQLVLYAWSGLGATFGPLLIMSLYGKILTPRGAWAGMMAGGGCVALWPLIGTSSFPSLVAAFPLSLLVLAIVSKCTAPKEVVCES